MSLIASTRYATPRRTTASSKGEGWFPVTLRVPIALLVASYFFKIECFGASLAEVGRGRGAIKATIDGFNKFRLTAPLGDTAFSKMEGKFAEKLRSISEVRSRLLTRTIPAGYFENTALFHALLFTTTLLLIVAMFVQLRALKLFAFHPICMSIGTLIFFGEGLVAYRNRSMVETFSPIMQHNKKIKVRVIHQTMQMIGAAFLGMGLLFMFANKALEKKTIVPHTLHSIVGSVVLVLIVLQAVSGAQKMNQLESKVVVKIRRWHGDSGLLLWDLLCITILLGMLEFFYMSFTNLLVELCVVGVWMSVHAQMRRKGDFSSEERGEGSDLILRSEPSEQEPVIESRDSL